MKLSLCRMMAATIPLLILPLTGAGVVFGQATSGAIQLSVDATRAPQKILHAQMAIPVKPGPLVLYYPEWIPGEHMPDGPITDLAGLKFTANGQQIPWRRDLVSMFTIHLDVPAGITSLNADLDFLLAAPASGFSGGASATAELALISWNQVLLYPAGRPVADILFEPSLRLPPGWKFATALPGARESGDTIYFAAVPLDMLVDSPVLSGEHLRAIQLSPGQNPPHELDMASDSEAALAIPAATEAEYRNLVAETGPLFGARHYRDYHFLLTLSDDTAHFGLEHHESSDDRVAERMLIDDNLRLLGAGLLPHEFTHSWNGKYRRPADLSTPDYQQPMRDDLLWVYEGLTQYLGSILTARSGLWTTEQYRENLATVIATLTAHTGRTWRPLQDTADAAQILYDAPEEWSSWRRGVDYYDEGILLWLAVDTKIRTESHGKRSLDDFCRSFYGGPGGEPTLKTYTFDDIVSALNSVAPYDWTGMLNGMLTSLNANPPLEGLHASGWDLAWDENPNEIQSAAETVHHVMNLDSTLGMRVDADGVVHDVIIGRMAFAAGIGPDMKITAVNGRQFSLEVLQDAVRDSRSASVPIELLVANGSYVHPVKINYRDGLRYPHLVPISGQPDMLSEILKPLAER